MFLRVAIQEDVEDVQIIVQGVPHLFSLVLQDDELQDATSCYVLLGACHNGQRWVV